MRKQYLLLGLIILLAVFLRFYQLGTNPPSLTWDEASWGYNAYSLGVDGRDEFGRFLPLNYLESFGDFKPPVYAYLDVIPVKLFGLTEFATRFPSALFGVLTVLLTYFLTGRIFQKSKNKDQIAILSALFLAISPWHIILSRAAFEANVAAFLLVGGVWLFLAGIQEKKWYIVFSAIFFAISIYTFNTARVVAPILVLLLGLTFRKELIENKKHALMAVLVGISLTLPIINFLFSPQASLRFKEVNIFSDTSIVEMSNQEIANDNYAWWSKIIHNRRFLYGVDYLKHYFDNFNPGFLFITGDGNPKFSTQTVGQMYVWGVVFFLSGWIFLFKKKEGNWWLIPSWLLIGIIPAALAKETPHALRIESSLPTFQILTAYGFVQLVDKIKKYKKLIVSCLLFFLAVNFFYFYHDYFYNYKYDYSGEWQYGYKESINYVKSVENNYDFIQVSNSLGRPYIYYLFYTKTNPDYFRETASISRDIFGFVAVNSFGKYVFPQNFNHDLSATKKVLYLDNSKNLPSNAKVLKRFYLLNGQEKLVAYSI
ncbi:MAG: glycosyltransferase family 39 protein [bacterium]|nr:glycosyltransferase family 39 protein [bacterium]